jgi:hypothetical protein
MTHEQARWKLIGLVAFAAAVVLLQAGCGSGENRKAVFGNILGAEGQNGSLSLVPAEGNAGPSAITEIKNGAYQFDSSNGPAPGPHAAHILLEKESKPAEAPDNPKVALPQQPAGESPLGRQFTSQVTVPEQAPFQVDIPLSAGSSGDNR